jgi:acylphosphatase
VPDRIARHLVIHGRVQGVFFRASARDAARTRGVCGWAENRADGTVGVFVEGSPDAVESMIAWCHHGPGQADVARVDVEEVPVAGCDGFATR